MEVMTQTYEIIERCRESKSKRLDLGECGLSEIPDEIWKMDWVEELVLGNNPTDNSNYELFKVDPKVYSMLFPGSDSTDEGQNQSNVALTNGLEFTANKFGNNLFSKANFSGIQNLKKLRYLNLNRCDLLHADFLFELKQIDTLLIGGNPRLRFRNSSIEKKQRLKVRVLDLFGIYARSTGKSNLSDSFPNNLNEIIDEDYLQILDISYNNFARESGGIRGSYKNLISIDFGYTNDRTLFRFLANPSLTFIRAEGCEIISIRRDDVTTNLKYLNLNSSKISELFFLREGLALEKLLIARNSLTSLAGIEHLSRLQVLNCENNKVKDINPVAGLSSLKSVFASGNQIADLPSFKNLKSLEVLSLSENQISSANQVEKTLSELPQLKTLHLFKNPLTEIPVTKLGADRYFNCLEGIAHHFTELTKTGSEENNEIKLILIGNSTAGKTTLRKIIQEKPYDSKEDTTHGIVMETWSLEQEALRKNSDDKPLQVHIWDFGGQEYYHETHKLFFSDNAVYVVVWENKTNVHKIIPTEMFETRDGKKIPVTKFIEHQPYDYWLKNIRHYAPNCNVIVVQNKIDTYLEAENTNTNTDTNADPNANGNVNAVSTTAKKQNDLQTIRVIRLSDKILDDYNVYQAFDLSLKYAKGETDYVFDYQKFERQLKKILGKAVHQFKIGKSYNEVKEKIRDRQENFLPYNQYRDICKNAGIDEKDIPQLSKYLTDTSVILHFQDHPTLKETVFINPVWVSDTIYSILDSSVLERSGAFDESHVKAVLRNEKLASDFIELMKKFELIFPLSEEAQPNSNGQIKKFIAPQYLPEGSPTRSYGFLKEFCGAPKLIIRFPQFLPKTFMNGLLAKFAYRSVDKAFFRYGVAFSSEWLPESKGNINIIECKFEEEKIEVYSKSSNPYNLREIFEAILSIYKGFRSTAVQNQDPSRPIMGLMDEVCRSKTPVDISVDGQNFISWNDLYKRWNNIVEADPNTNPDAEPITDVPSDKMEDDTIVMPVEGAALMAGLFKAYYLDKSEVQSLGTISQVSLEPPKLFISYSHKDELYKDELLEHLSGMRRSGEIKDWTDRAIVSGEKWDDVIKKNIEEADMILFLLSSSFIASDYIQNIEIKNAIERHNRKKVVIIPIPVRPCDYKSLPLRDIQSASKDFKPISTFTSRDEGWTGVIGNLRSAIDKWKSDRNGQSTNGN